MKHQYRPHLNPVPSVTSSVSPAVKSPGYDVHNAEHFRAHGAWEGRVCYFPLWVTSAPPLSPPSWCVLWVPTGGPVA